MADGSSAAGHHGRPGSVSQEEDAPPPASGPSPPQPSRAAGAPREWEGSQGKPIVGEDAPLVPAPPGGERGDHRPGRESGRGTPWWAPLVLAAAVLSVSSAGAVMKSVQAAAPLALASWRLQATALLLLGAFLFQLRQAPLDVRECFSASHVAGRLSLSGLFLAAHFGLWVYSLTATSLPHSLLFVSTPPFILACHSLARGVPLANGEGLGLLVGSLGVLLVAASAGREGEVTWMGDAAALGSAVAFAAYITVAKGLREWMPLYLFAFPVTAISACVLGILTAIQEVAGLVQEEALRAPAPHSVHSPFAWMSPPFLLPVLYLALGPGFVGHTGLNAVLRHMSALTLSMAITLEPVLGSLLGWVLGQTGAPSLLTCLGGTLLLLATVLVAYLEETKGQPRVKERQLQPPGTEGQEMEVLWQEERDG